jgi:hypothetical protein
MISAKINNTRSFLRMSRTSYLFWTALLAVAVAAAVMSLMPATRSAEAQAPSMSCMDIRDSLATNEKLVVKYQSYVDIKINPEMWREKLGKLDRAIAAGNVLSEANSICRLLACTALDQGTDLESRMRFQKDVRDILARAIDDVLKMDAARLSEDLASARRNVSDARADLRNKGCENIQVLSATYGGNCRAPLGNVTNSLRAACDGKELCSYRVDYLALNDPVPGCDKDYSATWRCGFDGQVVTTTAAPQTGYGPNLILSCEK